MHIDIFSGDLAALPKGRRTVLDALKVLALHPRVSTFDRGEHPWLDRLIHDLKAGKLIEERDEPYPWHRFALTDAGRLMLVTAN